MPRLDVYPAAAPSWSQGERLPTISDTQRLETENPAAFMAWLAVAQRIGREIQALGDSPMMRALSVSPPWANPGPLLPVVQIMKTLQVTDPDLEQKRAESRLRRESLPASPPPEEPGGRRFIR